MAYAGDSSFFEHMSDITNLSFFFLDENIYHLIEASNPPGNNCETVLEQLLI